MRRTRRRSQRGFTLIELMISLVLFSLVITGLLSVAVTMTKGFRDQEVTISAEGATRATVDYMAEAVRGASPGVPLNTIVDLDSGGCEIGALRVVNNIASTNPGVYTNTSDSLTVLYASGAVVTTLRGLFTAPGSIAVEDSTQLNIGDFVVITNYETGHLVRVSASSNSAPGTITIDTFVCGTPNLPTSGYLAGAQVVRATRAKFSIGAIDGIPVLMMDTDAEGNRFVDEPIAEGIEDLEIVVGIDANGDGVLSAEDIATAGNDEWVGNVSGEVIPDPLPAGVRAIRISLVARTTKEFSGVNTFRLGALEDRAANGTTDNFRRRLLSTSVEIRNLGGSP